MTLRINSFEYLFPVVMGAILFALLAAFIIYFILLYRKSQTKLHFERERILQELLRVENEVKEQTLVNVSRELHDNLGQVASLIKINMNMLSKKLEGNELIQINELITLIKQLITDIKSLSDSLKGERLKQLGWLESITEEARRFNTIEGFDFKLQIDGESELTHEQELILFRMIQEMLNNTMKHSRANEAALSVTCAPQKTSIHYSDNGIGFKLDSVKRGAGLNNMEDRCDLINANFELKSAPTAGTQISINLNHEHESR